VVALVMYLITCARTVTLVDSGELILACASLGVAHPPGFPVYTMIGHLFCLVPVGSVAFRLAAMSAVFAALTAALVTLIVGEVVVWAQRHRGSTVQRSRLALVVAPVGAGLSFAFAATLWSYATVAEVYSLNLALVAGSMWLLLRWRREGAQTPIPWGVGLLIGLGFGVHHVTVLLVLPGLIALVVTSAGWRALAPRRLAPAVAGGVVGVLCYLYLPLAAAQHPVLNWGDPSNLERFWWHLTARQYVVNLFNGSIEQVRQNLVAFSHMALTEFNPLALALVAAGLAWLWRRDRAVLWMVVVFSLVGVAYAVNYNIGEDSEAYFLTTFLAAAVGFGGSLAWLVEKGRRTAALAVGLAVAMPAAGAALHWRACDRSHNLVARHLVEDTLAGVARGGLVLTREWQLYAPWLYLHHVEGFRPDAAVVDINLCRRSWYTGQYLPAAYPQLMAAVRPQVDAFLVKLEDWEHGRSYSPEELTRRFVGLLRAMLQGTQPKREAHLTLPTDPAIAKGMLWVPCGLTLKLVTVMPQALKPMPSLHLEPFVKDSEALTPVARAKVRPVYALMLANRCRYLVEVGDLDGARQAIDLALTVEPTSSNTHTALGNLEMTAGRMDAARAAYQKALREEPNNREAKSRLEQLARTTPG